MKEDVDEEDDAVDDDDADDDDDAKSIRSNVIEIAN